MGGGGGRGTASSSSSSRDVAALLDDEDAQKRASCLEEPFIQKNGALHKSMMERRCNNPEFGFFLLNDGTCATQHHSHHTRTYNHIRKDSCKTTFCWKFPLSAYTRYVSTWEGALWPTRIILP